MNAKRKPPSGGGSKYQYVHSNKNLNPEQYIYEQCLSVTGYAPPPDKVLSKIGRWLRFSITGKPSDKSGALKVHHDTADDVYVFIIKNHKTGATVKGSTRTAGNRARLTPEEKAAIRRQRQQLEQAERKRSARKRRMLSAMARRIWQGSSKPDYWQTPHDYLTRKNVPPLNIRRYQSHKRDALILPMVNVFDGIESLYIITPSGFKRPLKGSQTKGLCMAIGGDLPTAKTIWIAEGYATGVSLHLEVNAPVVVAFTAGNLEHVTDAITRKYPQAAIKLCADDDRQTAKKTGTNTGLKYAKQVQQRFPQVAIYAPLFPPDAPDGLSDVNDLVNYQLTAGAAS